MKEDNTIEVNNITKSFKVYLDKGNTAKERLLFRKRRRYESRPVLRGISFEVKKGEAIGLIGHNGCGKSTTLKMLSRIMYPDSGTIEMKGRVSSLIELGAGFHPDMSGRENIYINAAIFGLSHQEIENRLDDIIAFSELEDYIDNPVRTYSSGMYMRLAFSVAINVDADILLIDEILGVGDAGFQTKCFYRLKEIKENGTTIVIVSHSIGQIEQICDRSLWIHDGVIRAEGETREVDLQYLDYMSEQRELIAEKEAKRKLEKQEQKADKSISSEERIIEESKEPQKELVSSEPETVTEEEKKKRWGNGKARIEEIKINKNEKKNVSIIKTGESFNIYVQYSVKEKVKDAVFGIGIFRTDGLQCYGTNTRIDRLDEFDLKQDGTINIEIQSCCLLPGKYTLDIAIESGAGIPVDYYREAKQFEVISATSDVGVARLEHKWSLP